MSGNSSGGNIFLAIFTIFWCAIVGFFNYILFTQAANQFHTKEFVATTGVVTKFEKVQKVRKKKKGRTTHYFMADVEYNYSANGSNFIGRNYRKHTFGKEDHLWKLKDAEKYPIGSPLPVYYNPQDPADSVILKGLQGEDVFFAIFMLPFNLVALGLITYFLSKLAGKNKFTAYKEGSSFVIRLPQISPLLSGVIATGLSAFVLVFAIGIPYSMDPPLYVASGALLMTLLLGFASYTYTFLNLTAGKYNLVIDSAKRVITIPRSSFRKEAINVEMDRISHVLVRQHQKERRRKGRTYNYTVYQTCLFAPESGGQHVVLFEGEAAEAEELCKLLTASGLRAASQIR